MGPVDQNSNQVPAIEPEPQPEPQLQPQSPQPRSPQLPPLPPQQVPDAPQQPAVLPVKKSKKGLIIGLVSAGVLVLGIASSALAYTFVYNNPDNAVADAFMKMFTAKSAEMTGTVSIKTQGTGDIKVGFSGMADQSGQEMIDQTITLTVSGQDITIKTHFAASKDSVYVKIDDLNVLIDKIYGADSVTAQDVKDYFDSFISKIDSKWVVLKYSDLDSLTSGAVKGSQVTCVVDQMNKLKTDSKVQNEIKDAYNKNRFIKVESKGSDGDGNRYSLTVDETKSKDFGKKLQDTQLFKGINDCTGGQMNKTVDDSSSDVSDVSSGDVTLDMWVDGWSHNPNKILMTVKSGSGEFTMELKPKLNTNPKVTIPTGQTTIDDLKTEIESVQEQMMPSYSTPYDVDDTSF